MMLAVTAISYAGTVYFCRTGAIGSDSRDDSRSKSLRRGILFFLLIVILMPLVWFKYSGFFGLPGREFVAGFALLPPGISFYTFQNISAVVDSYRKRQSSRIDAAGYFSYILFFPQLIAGPIVRTKQFFRYMQPGRIRLRLQEGAGYLVSGYFRKAVLADHLAPVADAGFSLDASGSLVLIAVIAFALQIYFDFSGYTHIAMGVAALCGIRLPENFLDPYFATGFQDFWRRWHRTLSQWLRDYIYIPLGGSRRGPGRMFMALLATMFIGGLWHGAHWNFVIWGGLHGLLLVAEYPLRRLLYRNEPAGLSLQAFRLLYRFFVLVSVVLLWIPFRAAMGSVETGTLDLTIHMLARLFSLLLNPANEALHTHFESQGLLVLYGIAALVLLRYFSLRSFFYKKARTTGRKGDRSKFQTALAAFFKGLIAGLLLLLWIYLAPGAKPFLYFVF